MAKNSKPRKGSASSPTGRKPSAKESAHDAHQTKEARSEPLLWLAMLGVPGISISSGFSLIGPDHFWLAFGCLMFGVFAIAFDLLFVWKKIGNTFGAIAIIVTIIFAVSLFRIYLTSAPLGDFEVLDPTGYTAGTDVYGIKWKAEYKDEHIFLENPTSADYSDLEVILRTNTMIDDVGFNKDFSQCSGKAFLPGLAVADVKITTPEGTRPLFDGSAPTSATFYRIKCDKIYARSKIETILAVNQGSIKYDTQPRWLVMKITYLAGYRRRSFFINKCFSQKCEAMPGDINLQN